MAFAPPTLAPNPASLRGGGLQTGLFYNLDIRPDSTGSNSVGAHFRTTELERGSAQLARVGGLPRAATAGMSSMMDGRIPAPEVCACCGGSRPSKLGEDITETLEVIPWSWKVIQTVRERFLVPGLREHQPVAGALPCDAPRLGGPNLLSMIVF
jgi:hypothetical protein